MTTTPQSPVDEFGEPMQQPQKKGNMTVVGINLLVFFIYTAICHSTGPDGLIIDVVIAGIHFVVALIIIAIDRKRWTGWLLSAFMVLVLGFATCVMSL